MAAPVSLWESPCGNPSDIPGERPEYPFSRTSLTFYLSPQPLPCPHPDRPPQAGEGVLMKDPSSGCEGGIGRGALRCSSRVLRTIVTAASVTTVTCSSPRSSRPLWTLVRLWPRGRYPSDSRNPLVGHDSHGFTSLRPSRSSRPSRRHDRHGFTPHISNSTPISIIWALGILK